MNPKLILRLCAVFLMIWSSSAILWPVTRPDSSSGNGSNASLEDESEDYSSENSSDYSSESGGTSSLVIRFDSPPETVFIYKNYQGPLISHGQARHPSELCKQTVKDASWYRDETQTCSGNITCSASFGQPLVNLGVKPDTGVVCSSDDRCICVNGTAYYMQVEEFPVSELTNSSGSEFPTNICRNKFDDAAAQWINSKDEDRCSADVLCYLPNKNETVSSLQKPHNLTLVGSKESGIICVNGESKYVANHGGVTYGSNHFLNTDWIIEPSGMRWTNDSVIKP